VRGRAKKKGGLPKQQLNAEIIFLQYLRFHKTSPAWKCWWNFFFFWNSFF